MMLAAGILLLLSIVPQIPFFPFFLLALAAAAAAYLLLTEQKEKELAEQQSARQASEKPAAVENVLDLLVVEPFEIEIGYNLISLTDQAQGGDLLERITVCRRQCALELGIVVQPIRIRDNLQLPPNTYRLKLKGNEIAAGELRPGHFLAMNPLDEEMPDLNGYLTTEPTFGLPAIWIGAEEREKAEISGYTVVDATTVLITHLTETIKKYAHELLGRQEIKDLLELVKEKQPAVVEELVPELLTLGEIQKVLQNLLRERVPIRDLVTIFETLADYARVTRELDALTEYVRQALARTICNLYTDNGKLRVISLAAVVEQKIAESIQTTAHGAFPVLQPQTAQRLFNELAVFADKIVMQGYTRRC